MKTRTFAAGCVAAFGAALATLLFAAEPTTYPVTQKIDHIDDYHGTKVADPYRWLEDETSPETAAWVEAQNAVTFPYLERIPYRDALRARVMELNDYERYGAPARKGPYFFFSKNEGLQNQSVLHIQRGLDSAPEVLLDPNSWSADGTVQLSAFEPSKDARLRRLRHLAERLGLAAIQSLRARDEAHARRHDRLGEGFAGRVARRRLLLQPLPRAARGP